MQPESSCSGVDVLLIRLRIDGCGAVDAEMAIIRIRKVSSLREIRILVEIPEMVALDKI